VSLITKSIKNFVFVFVFYLITTSLDYSSMARTFQRGRRTSGGGRSSSRSRTPAKGKGANISEAVDHPEAEGARQDPVVVVVAGVPPDVVVEEAEEGDTCRYG
jgi:hypothetical protein